MSLRLVTSIANQHTGKAAKVYKDTDWNEYRVKFYRNGVYQSKADMHTDDKDDAIGTAEVFTLQ